MENPKREPLWHHHGNASPKVIQVGEARMAEGRDSVYGDGKGNVYRRSPDGTVRQIRQKSQTSPARPKAGRDSEPRPKQGGPMTLDEQMQALRHRIHEAEQELDSLPEAEKPFSSDYEIPCFGERVGKELPEWDHAVAKLARALNMPLNGTAQGRGGWLAFLDPAQQRAVVEKATIEHLRPFMPEFTDEELTEYLSLMQQSVGPPRESERYKALENEIHELEEKHRALWKQRHPKQTAAETAG